MENKNNNRGIIYINSQPPNIAEVVGLLNVMQNFDKVTVVLNGHERVASKEFVETLWTNLIMQLKNSDKIDKMMFFDGNLLDFTTLPEEFNEGTFCTFDKKLYAHFASIGIPVKLIPRLQGYHDIFLMVAYRQGLALDYLRKNY